MVKRDFSEEKTFKRRFGNDMMEGDVKTAEGTLTTKVTWWQEQSWGLGVFREQPVWQELRERGEEGWEVGANGGL